jgi:hypothetical protein
MSTSGNLPSYRDSQLHSAIRELRAAVKPFPRAARALQGVEYRLKFVLRVVQSWDDHHAERAETLIRLGKIEAANSAASLIFDDGLRADLLRRTPIGIDPAAPDRLAEAIELEREVLV